MGAGVAAPGVAVAVADGVRLTAGEGVIVTDGVGAPGRVLSYGVRFSAPVVVPDDDEGETVAVSGVVEEVHDDGTATVGLSVTVHGNKVLMGAKAVVRLA